MASPYDPWRNTYGMPGPQDPNRPGEIRASTAPRWEELLRGSDVTAINSNPLVQALQRYTGRAPSGIGEVTRVSPIDGRPVPPEPGALDRLPPTVQEGIGGLGLLANFLAPGVKLPMRTMAPEKGIGARPGPSALDPKAGAMGQSSVLAETAPSLSPSAWVGKTPYERADEVAAALRQAMPNVGGFDVIKSGSAAGNSAYVKTPFGDIRISDHGAHPKPGVFWQGPEDKLGPGHFVDLVSSRMNKTIEKLLAGPPPNKSGSPRPNWMSADEWREMYDRAKAPPKPTQEPPL